MAFDRLESHLRVKTKDGETFVLADNPGLLHLPSRSFGDVCFLANGNELVFDDYEDMISPRRRRIGRVGWIAHGSKAVTLTTRYQRKIASAKR